MSTQLEVLPPAVPLIEASFDCRSMGRVTQVQLFAGQLCPFLLDVDHDFTPPSDVAALQALLQNSEECNGRKDDRIERLEKLVADFKRALFGSKSENLSIVQYELALENIKAAIAAIHTEDEQDASPLVNPKEPRRTNRG